MLTLLFAVALHAAPSIAAPSFSVVNVPPEVGQYCADHLSAELNNRGLKVITAKEIGALIGLERQKQLLGCDESESNSCIAELANALGSEGLLLGSIAKLGNRYELTVKVVRSADGQQIASYLGSAEGDEELVPQLRKAAAKLAHDTFVALRPNEVPPDADVSAVAEARGRKWPIAPTVGAAVLAATSGVTYALALSKRDELRSRGAELGTEDADAVSNSGKTFQTVAFVSAGLAVAALGAAAVMYVVSGEPQEDSALSLTVGPQGVGVVGVFP